MSSSDESTIAPPGLALEQQPFSTPPHDVPPRSLHAPANSTHKALRPQTCWDWDTPLIAFKRKRSHTTKQIPPESHPQLCYPLHAQISNAATGKACSDPKLANPERVGRLDVGVLQAVPNVSAAVTREIFVQGGGNGKGKVECGSLSLENQKCASVGKRNSGSYCTEASNKTRETAAGKQALRVEKGDTGGDSLVNCKTDKQAICEREGGISAKGYSSSKVCAQVGKSRENSNIGMTSAHGGEADVVCKAQNTSKTDTQIARDGNCIHAISSQNVASTDNESTSIEKLGTVVQCQDNSPGIERPADAEMDKADGKSQIRPDAKRLKAEIGKDSTGMNGEDGVKTVAQDDQVENDNASAKCQGNSTTGTQSVQMAANLKRGKIQINPKTDEQVVEEVIVCPAGKSDSHSKPGTKDAREVMGDTVQKPPKNSKARKTKGSLVHEKRKRKRKKKSDVITQNSKKKRTAHSAHILPSLSAILLPFDLSVPEPSTSLGLMKLESVHFAPAGADQLPPFKDLIRNKDSMSYEDLKVAQNAPRGLSGRSSAVKKKYSLRGGATNQSLLVSGVSRTMHKVRVPTTIKGLAAQNQELVRENLKLRAELVLGFRNQTTSDKLSFDVQADQGGGTSGIRLPKMSMAIQLSHLASILSAMRVKEIPRHFIDNGGGFEEASSYLLCAKQGFDFIWKQMRLSGSSSGGRVKESVSTVFEDVHLKILEALHGNENGSEKPIFTDLFTFLLTQIKSAYQYMLDKNDVLDVIWSRTISETFLKRLLVQLCSYSASNLVLQLDKLVIEIVQGLAKRLREMEQVGSLDVDVICSAQEISTSIAMAFPEVGGQLSDYDFYIICSHNTLFPKLVLPLRSLKKEI